MNKTRPIYLLLIIILIWLVVLSFNNSKNTELNQTTNINQYNVSGFSTDFTKIIADNISSVVTINADNNILSGFVYLQRNEDVYIVTAYHGIADCNNINVIFASTYTSSAHLVGYDIYSDLAVLKIESPYDINPLKLADSSLLKQGEFVVCIGTPQSLDFALSSELAMVSKGVITIENTIVHNGERYNYFIDVLQLSSNITEGYSGSPILNMAGQLVGMNTMQYDSKINFALTVNELRIVVDKIIDEKEVIKNRLGIKGVYIKDMANYEKTNLNLDIEIISGLYVQKVKENSIALQSGIRSQDVIVKINNRTINNLDDYLNALYSDMQEFTFEIIRNGQSMLLGTPND